MDSEWSAKAACKGSAQFFFSPHVCYQDCDDVHGCRGRMEEGRNDRVKRAKEICQTCPVIEECREWALSVRLPDGVAGGMTERERRIHLKEEERRGIRRDHLRLD